MKVNPYVPMAPQSTVPTLAGSRTTINVPKVVTDMRLGPSVISEPFDVNRLPPTMAVGNSSTGNWQAIAPSTKIAVGDILRFCYTFRIPFFQEWQTNKFIAKIQNDDRYQLRHWALSEEEGRLWVEVKVLKPDFGITAILIAAAIAGIGIGIGFWLTTESIEKLFTVEIGDTKLNFTAILGIAAVVIGVPFLLKKV